MSWFKAPELVKELRDKRMMELIISVSWYGGLLLVGLAALLTLVKFLISR